jgi:hypothetical protein
MFLWPELEIRMHTSIGGAVESSDEDSRDNNSLEEIRTKEMPRYNKQAQMDGDELSVSSRAKWSPPLALFRYAAEETSRGHRG